jgi:hypothetical protein
LRKFKSKLLAHVIPWKHLHTYPFFNICPLSLIISYYSSEVAQTRYGVFWIVYTIIIFFKGIIRGGGSLSKHTCLDKVVYVITLWVGFVLLQYANVCEVKWHAKKYTNYIIRYICQFELMVLQNSIKVSFKVFQSVFRTHIRHVIYPFKWENKPFNIAVMRSFKDNDF